MSKIIPFVFDQCPIRVDTGDDGEPIFVGKDICDALGYKDATTAIRPHCKGVQLLHPLKISGGLHDTRVLSEPDVMRFIVNSTLPAAEKFEKLVFEVILPTIRKTGVYVAPSATLDAFTPALMQELTEIIAQAIRVELPQVLQAEIARCQASLRRSQTAAQVWAAHSLVRFKGGPQFLSRCLIIRGCASEGGGEPSQRKARMFDTEKSALAMKYELLEHCRNHVAERRGSLFTLKHD